MMVLPSYKTRDPRGWCGDPRRGAALGRRTVHGPRDFAGRFVLRRIRLDAGGYDSLGTYFGDGEPLYWYAAETDDGPIEGVLRASSRGKAKSLIRETYPNCRFYGGGKDGGKNMGLGTLITNEAWFCDDCTIAECNGDYTGMDEDRQKEVEAGFATLAKSGTLLTANFDSESGEGMEEFSWRGCDCCGTQLGGGRHRFAFWRAEEKKERKETNHGV